MADRPIIFSAPMILALLAGQKTQTRRLASSPLANVTPGTKLWAREAWRLHTAHDRLTAAQAFTAMGGDMAHCVDYLATPRKEAFWGKSRPSIHMPRWASRLTLTVTEVRVQRLQEISAADAMAEGIQRVGGGVLRWEKYSGAEGQSATCPRAAFALLWNSLHGPDAWDENPEVVAISFRCEQRNIDA